MRLLRPVVTTAVLGFIGAIVIFWHSGAPQKRMLSGSSDTLQFLVPDEVNQDNSIKPLVVIGDTQRTLFVERLIGREQNDAEREALIKGLVAENPGLLVHVGDFVNDGGNASVWSAFDALFAPIRAARIPVLPCMGNHDYWGNINEVTEYTQARFPTFANSTHLNTSYGPIGLIALDSNEGKLKTNEWNDQKHWFENTLKSYENSPLIKGVLVFGHHSPFTNSEAPGDELLMQTTFLPIISKFPKVLAMITGHVHTYEHFFSNNIHFIVSGGGGGPRVKLLSGSFVKHQDWFTDPSPRPFEYLLLTYDDLKLHVAVRGFNKGETAVRTINEFDMIFRTQPKLTE